MDNICIESIYTKALNNIYFQLNMTGFLKDVKLFLLRNIQGFKKSYICQIMGVYPNLTHCNFEDYA